MKKKIKSFKKTGHKSIKIVSINDANKNDTISIRVGRPKRKTTKTTKTNIKDQQIQLQQQQDKDMIVKMYSGLMPSGFYDKANPAYIEDRNKAEEKIKKLEEDFNTRVRNTELNLRDDYRRRLALTDETYKRDLDRLKLRFDNDILEGYGLQAIEDKRDVGTSEGPIVEEVKVREIPMPSYGSEGSSLTRKGLRDDFIQFIKDRDLKDSPPNEIVEQYMKSHKGHMKLGFPRDSLGDLKSATLHFFDQDGDEHSVKGTTLSSYISTAKRKHF